MTTRIIDNKKVDLTDDEFLLYQKICESYSAYGGSVLFSDLFESDKDGIIIFLKPPSKKHTSFEIFLYLMSVMSNQHLRCMHKEVDDICSQMKQKMSEIEDKLEKLQKKK